jgi:hypothetical protein
VGAAALEAGAAGVSGGDAACAAAGAVADAGAVGDAGAGADDVDADSVGEAGTPLARAPAHAAQNRPSSAQERWRVRTVGVAVGPTAQR